MPDLLVGSLFWAAAWGAGLLVLRRLVPSGFATEGERAVFASALGLGIVAYAVLIAGSAGFLFRPVLATVLMVFLALSRREWMANARGLWAEKSAAFRAVGTPLAVFAVLTGGAAVLLALAGALAPATGQDELCYHLTQPKNFVREHRIYAVPYSVNSLWPYLTQMLYTLGLLFRGAALAKLFHFFFYLTVAGAVGTFLTRFSTKRTAVLGALTFLLTPALYIQAAYAYVDASLACYVFLAFYALLVFFEERRPAWAVLAGICAGLAASTKLLGLFVLPLAAAALVWRLARDRSDRTTLVRGGALFVLAACAAGAVWYVRAAVLLGNPVYPFYPALFGGHGFEDPTYVDSHARGADLPAFLLSLWDLTLKPQWFGGEHIGPFYLAFVPPAFLFAFSRRIHRAPRAALWIGAGYAALWFMVDPNVRFFFPVLALWAAASAPVIADLWETRSRFGGPLARGLIAGMFLLSAAFAGYHFWDEAVLLVRGGREAYLLKHERSYGAARVMNALLGPADTVLATGEMRGYYFDRPFVLDGDLERMTRYGARARSADEAAAFLGSIGVTHVLVSSMEDGQEPAGWRALRLARDPEAAARFLSEEIVVRSLGVRYVLYRLYPPSGSPS